MECWNTGFGGMRFIFIYMTLIFYIHGTDQKLKLERHPLFIPNIPFFHHSNFPSVIKRQMLPLKNEIKAWFSGQDSWFFGPIVLSSPGLPQIVPWFRSCMKRIRHRFRVGFRWRLVLRIHTRLNRSPIPQIRNLRNHST